MSRRGDPERIYQAQRAGIFRRLVDAERVDELEAEPSDRAGEREATELGHARGSTGYWDEAWRWIIAERAAAR